MTSPFIAPGWRCSPSEAPARLVEAVRDAVACIGLHEQPAGSNRGPEVDVWLRLAHAEPGQPWCASFLTACYQRADPAPIPRLASALKIRQWAEAHGKLLPEGAPLLPGDICGIVRDDGHGHVGMVVADLFDGLVASIEGNVRSAVRGCVRGREEWQFFVRVCP